MRYTKTHDWVKEAEEGKVLVGITVYAQQELGEIVYIELPKVGQQLQTGDLAVVLESTKAAIDIYAPVGGEVVAVNTPLIQHPEQLNQDPEGEGWLYALRRTSPQDLHALLDVESYLALLS